MNKNNHKYCVLCWSYDIINNNPDSTNSIIEESSLVIFLLRQLCHISRSQVINLLRNYGHHHPSDWISLCGSCSQMVNHGRDLYLQIQNLSDKLRNQVKIKREIFDDEQDQGEMDFPAMQEIRQLILSTFNNGICTNF